MLDSDADLLALIRDSGGVTVKCNQGEFQAIFDHEFIEVEGQPGVESRTPVLTCRTSDFERLELRKNSNLDVGGEHYRIQRPEPDGTGITKLVLRK